MSAIIMMSLTFSSLFMIPLMSQPLSLGLSIMYSTLMMCLMMGMFLSSWYGYVLFLIYIGGLLVMFAYVAALSPNMLFGSMFPMVIYITLFCVSSVFIYWIMFTDVSSIGILNFYMSLEFNKMLSIEMVSPQVVSILIGLAIILLITLVVVVKICYYQQTSLRPFKT
uniref:NADH-ubiquinone oxidoreductase chain 6 n=1 Tax=Cymbium olla TaxID=543401 RepID=C8XQU1_CYMOL|nr:NADH dehydrogenase subunit 6 [Cymbium olla]ACF04872.1 NADH dehydrogenase subunit 6 [Cymbium olla]